MSGIKEICQCLENAATGILIALQRTGKLRADELYWTMPDHHTLDFILPSQPEQYPLVTDVGIIQDKLHWCNVLDLSATGTLQLNKSPQRAAYLYVRQGSIGIELRLHFNNNQEYLYTGNNEHFISLKYTLFAIKTLNLSRL